MSYPPVLQRALDALTEEDREEVVNQLDYRVGGGYAVSAMNMSHVLGVLGQRVGPTTIKEYRLRRRFEEMYEQEQG